MDCNELIDSARDRIKMEREDRMGESLSLLWNEDDRDDHEAVAEIERLVNEFTQTVVSILEVLAIYGLIEKDEPSLHSSARTEQNFRRF